jgi:hypothetical protein
MSSKTTKKKTTNNKILHASGIKCKNGKIDRKNYKSTSDSMFQIASCSKFITSIVVVAF